MTDWTQMNVLLDELELDAVVLSVNVDLVCQMVTIHAETCLDDAQRVLACALSMAPSYARVSLYRERGDEYWTFGWRARP